MTDTPWKDMTPEQRSARMAEGKRIKAAERAAMGEMIEREIPNDHFNTSIESSSSNAVQIETPKDLFGSVDLTDDEIAAIYAEAVVKVAKERKAAKKAAMMDAALESARREAGLIVDQPKDLEAARLAELVTITIDLPEGGGPDGVRLDQHCYRHGLTYTVSRAVYETIIDIQNKAWVAEALFDGKASNHYNRRRGRYELAYGGGAPSGTRSYHAGA
jgi:hypothetical protein